MNSKTKPQYRLGDLVAAAFDDAARMTEDRERAARLATRTLAAWIAGSNRPELNQRLRAEAA